MKFVSYPLLIQPLNFLTLVHASSPFAGMSSPLVILPFRKNPRGLKRQVLHILSLIGAFPIALIYNLVKSTVRLIFFFGQKTVYSKAASRRHLDEHIFSLPVNILILHCKICRVSNTTSVPGQLVQNVATENTQPAAHPISKRFRRRVHQNGEPNPVIVASSCTDRL